MLPSTAAERVSVNESATQTNASRKTTHFPFILTICSILLLLALESRKGFFDAGGLLALLFVLVFGIYAFFIYRAQGSVLSTQNVSGSADSVKMLPEKVLLLLLQVAFIFELCRVYADTTFGKLKADEMRHPEWIFPLCFVGFLTCWQPSRHKMPHIFVHWNRWKLLLILACYLAITLSFLLPNSPQFPSDVTVFQRDASAALLRGINPYTITFPNIFFRDDSIFYGPGLSINGVLQFGYVYTPLSLFLDLPGYLLGDLRFSHLAAMAATAALLASLRKGRVALLAATLLLFTPTNLFMLQIGWIESFVGLALAFVLYCAVHRPKWLPLSIGILLASKQYLVLIIPLLFLLWPRSQWRTVAWRQLAIAGLWALFFILPMALWNWQGFVKSTILLQFRQPFREDSLSFLAFAKVLDLPAPSWIPFALIVPLTWWILRRASNRSEAEAPALFSAAIALFFLVFFAFNKQAFVNYYYFVLVAFLGAIAAFPAIDSSIDERISSTRNAETDDATPEISS